MDHEADKNRSENNDIVDKRLQNILSSLSKCKIDFINQREESKKVCEINTKLELEVKETRELEKSHRYHLLSSREMICNLQETVSQLVHLKRDVKKLKEELLSRDNIICSVKKDKENLIQSHIDKIGELHKEHEKTIEELSIDNEKKLQQARYECDTQIAQFTCVIEELRSNIKEMEAENRDKMNVVVLEYEEKIQRGAAQVAQLQEQLACQAARADANIDAYRRRLEELEEKLKQSQFKHYLAQTSSYQPQYETQVERPYSVNRDPCQDPRTVDIDPVLEGTNANVTPMPSQTNANKSNKLQVIYYGNKTPASRPDKKGQFNITKKRKLYSDKNFQDF